MRLPEKITKQGYFWLPNAPDNKLPGTLFISVSGEILLEVLGSFDNFVQGIRALSLSNPEIPRIVGSVEDFGLVTLERCFYRNKSLFSSTISKSKIIALFAFSSVGYEDKEAISFSRCVFSIEGLDEWLGISGIKVALGTDPKNVVIYFSPPEKIAFQLPDDITMEFTFSSAIPAPKVTEAKITQKASISLVSEKLRPLEDYLTLIEKIKNFLCFAIDETVSVGEVNVYSINITQKIEEEVFQEVPIGVYYKSAYNLETTPEIQWHSMLFRYGVISSKFGAILQNWLAQYEIAEPAFNLYFASKFGVHQFLEGSFLSLAQGIEVLHRRTTKEKLTFSQRVQSMIKPFQSYDCYRNSEGFIQRIVDTRNYLTHYNEKLADKAAKGVELWELHQQLEALFQLHFLRLIGLEEELIHKLVSESTSSALRHKLNLQHS
ncbi:MAG: hypothetical protein PHU06_09840 [Gallionella sp.]|nr:hypothetical protein [Gallionella sp.]MDD4960012.1 hypothetical protein [Gallionella sp.]